MLLCSTLPFLTPCPFLCKLISGQDGIDSAVDTPQEIEWAKELRENVESLIPVVSNDIVKLVVSYKDPNTDLVQLEEDFLAIDKEVDLYANPAMLSLDSLDESIAEELEVAFEELDNTVAFSTMLSLVISVVTIIGIALVFTLFARSIVKSLTTVIEILLLTTIRQ